MRTFELLANDFWGKHPEKLTHELDEDVLMGFIRLVSDTLDEFSSVLRDGGNGRSLAQRAIIRKRQVICRLEVSANMGTAVFVFRATRPKTDNTGAFYAYAICSVSDSWQGYSSCVMGNDMGEYVCEVALKQSSANALITHLQLQAQKSWVENC